jgi:DNA-binding transcriptional regulator YhcF (GntR family)
LSFIEIQTALITPIYEQIKDSIMRAIDQEGLKKGDRLPSINSICREFRISPGTVIKAYDDLCGAGILSSIKGKGYFVASTRLPEQLNIFVLFDRINAYKEILYDSFMHHIGPTALVNVFFHHYDVVRFNWLISENLGKYNFYVIMPHFNHDVSSVLHKIPKDKLLIIDKEIPRLKGQYASICQHFKEDIFGALTKHRNLFTGFKKVNLVKSPSKFQFIPDGIIRGFMQFIQENNLKGEIIRDIRESPIRAGEVFIVFPESDLIYLIKKIKNNQWKIGKDVGVIAYDDSPMKEILEGGITVLSTDFEAMGKAAAELILSGKKEKLHNPFTLIKRKSF